MNKIPFNLKRLFALSMLSGAGLFLSLPVQGFPAYYYYVTVSSSWGVEGGQSGRFNLRLQSTDTVHAPIPASGPLSFGLVLSGSATRGTDYEVLNGNGIAFAPGQAVGTLTFAPGETLVTVSFQPIQDNIPDNAEEVILTVNGVVSSEGAARIVESNTVVLLPPLAPFVLEGPNAQVGILRRYGDTTSALEVTYELSGSATPGVDYTAAPNSTLGTFTFLAGQTFTTLSMQNLQDNVIEGDENIMVTLLPGPGYLTTAPFLTVDTPLKDKTAGTGLLPGALDESGFSFRILRNIGPAEDEWHVESSLDMIDWEPLTTRTLVIGEPALITDTGAAAAMARFYRAWSSGGEYSVQDIGFYRVSVPARAGPDIGGYSLIAPNLLDNLKNSSKVPVLFPNVPPSTLLMAMNSDGTFVNNTFNGTGWSNPEMTINPGSAVFLRNPEMSPLPLSFVGIVRQGAVTNTVVSGYNLSASVVPQAGYLNSLQYPALEGEQIKFWNQTNQGYQGVTFLEGYGWVNNALFLDGLFAVGQGFVVNSLSGKTWTRDFSVWSQKLRASERSLTDFELQVIGGKAGAIVDIEWSSDLVTWQELGSVTLGFEAPAFITDFFVYNIPARFYRAKSQLGRAYTMAGYYDVEIPARQSPTAGGYALVANHLANAVGDTVPVLFSGLPPQTMVIKFNPNGTHVENTFNGASWTDPTMTLSQGEAIFVRNPEMQAFGVSFLGTINEGTVENSAPTGYSLRCAIVPQISDINSLQLPATPDDQIVSWNVTNQSWGSLFQFDGNGWYTGQFNPDPGSFAIGQGFLFNSTANTVTTWKRPFSAW